MNYFLPEGLDSTLSPSLLDACQQPFHFHYLKKEALGLGILWISR